MTGVSKRNICEVKLLGNKILNSAEAIGCVFVKFIIEVYLFNLNFFELICLSS